MLRVRVLNQSTGWPAHEDAWEGVVAGRDERMTLARLHAFQSSPKLLGELLNFRVCDGQGGGCAIVGSLLECRLEAVEAGHVAEVRFSGKLKVW